MQHTVAARPTRNGADNCRFIRNAHAAKQHAMWTDLRLACRTMAAALARITGPASE
ncbi:hypothetical protein [Breoghania sp. L-A4]|uniref:hypothetical protein n=1 Tax=Breoghania sp. L-A4 TaxID=2304600 RepID=UPI0013C2F538|nr:hypothetical protein [Breoghania sp. L-A4]